MNELLPARSAPYNCCLGRQDLKRCYLHPDPTHEGNCGDWNSERLFPRRSLYGYFGLRPSPPTLPAAPANDSGGIRWGRDSAKVEAQIVSVAVECLPVPHPAVETEKLKRASCLDHQIAATAAVTYQIHDAKFVEQEGAKLFGGVDAGVIFEAVSANGVVLGSGTGRFRVVRGGTRGNVSANISGLSDSEIRRVVTVRARWEYGR